MLAAVLEKIDHPLKVCDVELLPIEFGQVLVRLHVSGICGSQLQEISGFKGNAKFLPHLLGHEGFGTVIETGVGVETVKVGDKVVMHWRIGTGIESEPPRYKLNGKIITSGKVTTFSEYAVVSENRVTAVKDSCPMDFGALLGCSI